MKTKVRNIGNSCYKLVIDLPGVAPKDLPVLGRTTHFFASGSWSIEDVRLAQHARPSAWFTVGGDHYQAHVNTKNEEEANLMRSLLTDFKEKPGSEGGVDFCWCTYEGLVHGRTGNEVSKFDVNLVDGTPLFHTRKDALLKLREMAEFWDKFPCDAAHPDAVIRAAAVKIDNPHRQISESLAIGRLIMFQNAIKPKKPRP